MGYTISGQYLVSCSCRLICPCAVDGKPTGPDDQCHAGNVFHVDQGSLDDVDLSGVNFALVVNLPSNITSGNWTAAVVVDSGATDEQAQAVEKIIKGDAGGPFAEFAPLISNFSLERGSVKFSDGGTPSASIEGVGDLTFDPINGPDGSPAVFRNAPLAFAPEVKLGRSSGKLTVFGKSVDASYGETADFVYSSEGPQEVHPRA